MFDLRKGHDGSSIHWLLLKPLGTPKWTIENLKFRMALLDGDSKALRSKSRSRSESSDTSLLKKQDFLPLSIDETSILVAKLIKCSDARAIEPLQNIIPKDIVSRVRKMLQEEQRT
ncbi:hypothetical protein ACTXT7_008441 [Hymenolepis weldensis]